MTNGGNPASMLFSVLAKLAETSGTRTSVRKAWLTVLPDVGGQTEIIATMCSLLLDVRKTVDRLQDPKMDRLYAQFSPAWLSAILGPEGDWNGSSEGLVDPGALVALEVVADLGDVEELNVAAPTRETYDDLRSALADALAAVREATDIPPEVSRLLVARLHDVLWAMDHIGVTGPDGVLEAVERLAASIRLTLKDEDLRRPLVVRAREVGGRVWNAFRIAGDAFRAIDGASEVFGILPPAPGA